MQFQTGLTPIALRVLVSISIITPILTRNASADVGDGNSNLPVDLVRNTARVVGTPSTAGILLLMGMTPAIADDETNKLYRPWLENMRVDQVFELGEWMGSGSLHAVASLSLYSSGKLLHKGRLASLGSDLFSAQFISSLMSAGLKVATARTRPDGAPYSFPSGHTTVAFATAGVIWQHCGKTAGITAQALAAYVALSRLQENKHYVSDIAAGCLLGNYVAFLVARDSSPQASSIKFSPLVSERALGLAVSKKF